jgi:hypothetical protein
MHGFEVGRKIKLMEGSLAENFGGFEGVVILDGYAACMRCEI